MKKLAIIAGMFLALGMASISHAATVVGTELALLVDVSGSISNSEFTLQRTGYVDAFKDPAVQAAIINNGGIAVTLVYWDDHQYQPIGWTLVNSAASANAFANAINATSRPGSNTTAPGSAINFIRPQFASNGFTSSAQVIDVSGDGVQNAGADTLTARNAAMAAGIDRINGLPIGGDPSVLAFYQTNIQDGANSFTLPAATYADFDSALKLKLISEISGTTPSTPLPSAALMGSTLLSGLAFLRTRFKKA